MPAVARAREVTIPFDWEPREYQCELWQALEGGCTRAVAVWHRRGGKDSVGLNWTIREAFRRVGMYWHVLPTYKQARKIIWDGMTKEGRKYLDHWPDHDRVGEKGSLVTRKRDDEMTLWLANGSIWQCVGAENQEDVDKLVGTNPVGVVFSEYSLHIPEAWDLIRPILAENGGWALFLYTPRGRNHGYRLYNQAINNPRWFAQKLTVDDTGVIPMDMIEDDRASGMAEELIQQEYWCSFDAPLVGSYYGDMLTQARNEGRIGKVPYEPKLEVETWWDLGIGDATAIWFVQRGPFEFRVINYYFHDGVGIDHYVGKLFDLKEERGYRYRHHLVPHDAAARQLGTGQTLVETARDMGVRMKVVPKQDLKDGIQAVRNILPKCYFDEESCETGIQALNEYTKEKISGVTGPNGEALYRDKPRHDWTSHPADAFRTGAVGSRPPRPPKKPGDLAPRLATV